MQNKFLFITVLLFCQLSFSKSNSTIVGRILNNNFLLSGVQIINLNTEFTTISDANGQFEIKVQAGELLVFIKNGYHYKRKIIESTDFEKSPITVILEKKPIELDDVLVTKVPAMPFILNSQDIVDRPFYDDLQSSPKVFTNLPNGTIENGINFVRIFDGIGKLLLKKSEDNNKKQISFKEIIATQIDVNLMKTLHIKEEDLYLFLDFCDADPKSKIIVDKNNIFDTMDFLISKNKEFNNLKNAKQN